MNRLLVIFITCFIVTIYSQEKIVTLPPSTLVVVRTQNELSGESLKAGQEVTCIVAVDVVIEDCVLIRAGAPVFCQVESASKSGMVGSGGDLSVSIQNTNSVDGKTIMLSGSFRTQGESSVGSKVAIGVILCPLALLASGDDAILPAGTQIRAFTIGEAKVKISK